MMIMSKRGRVALIVLVLVAVVGVIGTLYIVNGTPSTGMAYFSRTLTVPSQVNQPGNMRVDLPYSQRMSPYQYVYAPSYDNPGETQMSMFDCQSFCFGRPGNLPRHMYPKNEYGGLKLKSCLGECMEQRYGITDDTQHNWHYDVATADRPLSLP